MKDNVQWTTPCLCHAIFVEGGIALGCVTLALHGLNPKAVFLVGEGLIFAWWMCGIYTGLFRQELQRKYHLQVFHLLIFLQMSCLCEKSIEQSEGDLEDD
jgi:hypothetical protein